MQKKRSAAEAQPINFSRENEKGHISQKWQHILKGRYKKQLSAVRQILAMHCIILDIQHIL